MRRISSTQEVAPFTGAWIEIDDRDRMISTHGSLPSRERGLKSVPMQDQGPEDESLPSWERGLKFPADAYSLSTQRVAPFTGAWIEIHTQRQIERRNQVAPFTGAWIEIRPDCSHRYAAGRRSLHGSVD